MALKPDPSEQRRLIGDNTSEVVTLSIADATNFPLGGWMLGGDDLVTGSTANDLIFGNEGEDLMSGELGNDSLLGGKSKDFLSGDQGNDSLSGGQDADFVMGGAGNDILLGGRGNDFLLSGNGNDTLVGGLGRDILLSADDNNTSLKIGGSNLYVLQAEPGVTDVNNADFILGFRPAFDRIGLAGGLTASDVDLQYVTNVTVLFGFDAPESIKPFVPPGAFDTQPIQSQGTLIKVRNSGDIVGFVANVRVAEVQGSIISVQGF
ncbi:MULTISPECIES: calcium-binding protein [unclassified Microcoleus]|uniref:calcium-binding protein n=1 Tax=unclassified Microcoleus TaxID=2642155 RepID=UPI002FD2F367